MISYFKSKLSGRIWGLGVCLILVSAFIFFQPFETKSATDTEQVTLSVTVAQTITLDVDSATASFSALTPGTPVSASTVCTVTSNTESGYDLAVKRDDADTTMDKTTEAATNITDKTAWNKTTPNSAAYSGTGLAFGVFASTATKNTTWWGTGTTCHDANSLYAGFPTTYTNIMEHASYSSSSTTTSICYRLDVPATQKSGAYSGTITYQATSKP